MLSAAGCFNNSCQHGSTCVPSGWQFGSYNCTCPAGWKGVLCDAWVDPCKDPADNACALNIAICTNTGPNNYTCACKAGFTGDGVNCADVNECLNSTLCASADPNVVCVNAPGSYTCSCDPGFIGNPLVIGSCNACPEGAYQNGKVCTPCPPPSTCPSGSPSIAACHCPTGSVLDTTLQTCTQLACDAIVSFGAQWTSSPTNESVTGVCLSSYFVFSGVYPTDIVPPRRECLLSNDSLSAVWDTPVVECFGT